MRGLTCEDVSGGVGLRVTVPVTMGPDEAARELAPRLSALAGERATASSHGESARASHGVPVVTIDGYSGSGKSTLAAALARRGGRASSYEAWDWEAGATGETTRVPLAPTIIEGCGTIEAEADLAIWIADPGEEERRHRALARDGQTYAPHWWRWADQDLGRSIH
ncbi:MAG: hypothetical protein E6212_10435 [Actinomyces sp.]|nr:hypothetical protein [Actinomyces sp.]